MIILLIELFTNQKKINQTLYGITLLMHHS